MPRPWGNLSPPELELIVRDLLSVGLPRPLEAFAAGADAGVDLRSLDAAGAEHVVQVKHYINSSFAQLLAAARAEGERLTARARPPGTYRFVTSQALTRENKRRLREALAPFVTRDDDVLGRDDLEALLDRNPAIERHHIKLWLASGTQLAALTAAGTHARSRSLVAEIERKLPLLVQSEKHDAARSRIVRGGVVIVAGPPGIGKSTMAQMLVAEALADGYEAFELRDVDEAWHVFDPDARQIFYDDFLGATMLDAAASREETRLLRFMSTVEESEHTRFVLTTREYILQQATLLSEALRRHGLEQDRLVLDLSWYSLWDRARMLHNHIWHSPLPEASRAQIAAPGRWRALVLHDNFSPRLVEQVTGFQRISRDAAVAAQDWPAFALAAFDDPSEIWRGAYERGLSALERIVLECLATFADRPTAGDVLDCALGWCARLGVPADVHAAARALRVLQESFVSVIPGNPPWSADEVRPTNPGLLDFLRAELQARPGLLDLALETAVDLAQVEVIWTLLPEGLRPAREPTLIETLDRLWPARPSSNARLREVEVSALTWCLRLVSRSGGEELLDVAERLVAHALQDWIDEPYVDDDVLVPLTEALLAAEDEGFSLPGDWRKCILSSVWARDEDLSSRAPIVDVDELVREVGSYTRLARAVAEDEDLSSMLEPWLDFIVTNAEDLMTEADASIHDLEVLRRLEQAHGLGLFDPRDYDDAYRHALAREPTAVRGFLPPFVPVGQLSLFDVVNGQAVEQVDRLFAGLRVVRVAT